MNTPALLLADTLVAFWSAQVIAQQRNAPLQSSDQSDLHARAAETLIGRLP